MPLDALERAKEQGSTLLGKLKDTARERYTDARESVSAHRKLLSSMGWKEYVKTHATSAFYLSALPVTEALERRMRQPYIPLSEKVDAVEGLFRNAAQWGWQNRDTVAAIGAVAGQAAPYAAALQQHWRQSPKRAQKPKAPGRGA